MPFETSTIERPAGYITDLNRYELPPTVWTVSNNVSNKHGRSNRATGATSAYGTIGIQPLFNMYWEAGSNNDVWLYADTTSIYWVDSTEVPVPMRTTGLTATTNDGWSGCVLNGVAILNNGADAPQSTTNGAGVYSDTQCVDLPNWPSGYSCAVMRPYKNYLIALNVTDDSSNNFNRKVKWSSPTEEGTVPANWTISPGSGAGEFNLSDTLGACIDGKALGDSFIVYKEDAVWALDFIGGDFTFQFRKLFDDDNGILAKDCVVEFEGKHFVLTRGDAYVHDGTTKRSLMSGKVSDDLFPLINETYFARTKVVADQVNKDIWVYYPDQSSTIGLANKAVVWNWESDTWSRRDIEEVSHIAAGLVRDTTDDSWNNDTENWEDDTTYWDENSTSPAATALVASDYTNSRFLELNKGTTWAGTSYTTTLERQGVDFDDQTTWKRVNAIYPVFTGGGVVDISVGHEDPVGSGVVYEGPYRFNIGTDSKINCRVNGRNIALKIESVDNNIWALTSYTVEWKPTKQKR